MAAVLVQGVQSIIASLWDTVWLGLGALATTALTRAILLKLGVLRD